MFTLVYLVFNTISNLLEQAEQVACFGNAEPHLVRSGRFVVELWVHSLSPERQATVWRCEPGYIGLDTHDVLRQRVVSHHFRFGEGRQARLFRSPHRYIWPAELDLMAGSRDSSWSAGTRTGRVRSSPPSPDRTCRSAALLTSSHPVKRAWRTA